jgi:hypothetical protein
VDPRETHRSWVGRHPEAECRLDHLAGEIRSPRPGLGQGRRRRMSGRRASCSSAWPSWRSPRTEASDSARGCSSSRRPVRIWYLRCMPLPAPLGAGKRSSWRLLGRGLGAPLRVAARLARSAARGVSGLLHLVRPRCHPVVSADTGRTSQARLRPTQGPATGSACGTSAALATVSRSASRRWSDAPSRDAWAMRTDTADIRTAPSAIGPGVRRSHSKVQPGRSQKKTPALRSSRTRT